MSKVLLLIRGAPGAGKSTIANALVRSSLFNVFIEADQYFSRTGEYKYSKEEIGDAHDYCMDKTYEAMEDKLNVIVSNTFTKNRYMKPYEGLAKIFGYEVQYMTLESAFTDVHNVPADVVLRMKQELKDSLASRSAFLGSELG